MKSGNLYGNLIKKNFCFLHICSYEVNGRRNVCKNYVDLKTISEAAFCKVVYGFTIATMNTTVILNVPLLDAFQYN